MKKVRKVLIMLIFIICFSGLFKFPVWAEENADAVSVTEMNQVMTAAVDCDAREFPESEAAVITSYTAGSPVWVTGETQDGWYQVSYQNLKGYIPKDCIVVLQIEVEDQETVSLEEAGLDAEMEAVEAENKMLIEEIERQGAETKRSHIWLAVIIILVIGIFATGIVSTIKASKDSKK